MKLPEKIPPKYVVSYSESQAAAQIRKAKLIHENTFVFFVNLPLILMGFSMCFLNTHQGSGVSGDTNPDP